MVVTVFVCSLVDKYYLQRKEKLDKKLSDKSARIALEKLYDVDKKGVENNGYTPDLTDPLSEGNPKYNDAIIPGITLHFRLCIMLFRAN